MRILSRRSAAAASLAILAPVAAATAAELPDLPARSPRNASYTIDARLDPAQHTIEGSLVLEWRNTSDAPRSTFPFHLYWNAFRNTLSTSARGEGPRGARFDDTDRGFGYTHLKAVQLLGNPDVDLMPTLRYVHPDDANADDRTLAEVTTPAPVAPGASVRFRIEWTSRIPLGRPGRAGWVRDYLFVAQWFPKIGVPRGTGWSAHQFHSLGEFFSDYGSYDVRLTMPRGLVVGATGRLQGPPMDNADGTRSLHFAEQDVHDFAWTASPLFLERTARFDDDGYPPVDIRLLVQPEHAGLADRYLDATKTALRRYGAWSAPYPYGHVTVVDAPWGSTSGGMEYPTLFTSEAHLWSPRALQEPEGVTIHEAGHQFWYGLVGNDEADEAWLDEGINSYFEDKAVFPKLGPSSVGTRYFGARDPRGRRTGWPVIAPGVRVGRGEGHQGYLRENGRRDPFRRSWDYDTWPAYYTNSYDKPAATLQTLEAIVGDEVMVRVFNTFARRFRFDHPTTEDFIRTVNEVTGKDYRWFFDETWFSSGLCDYAIEAKNAAVPRLRGYADSHDGPPALVRPAKTDEKAGPFQGTVTVRRLGEVRMPVEVLIELADGQQIRKSWDGRERWQRFTFDQKVRRAVVDPAHVLAIDVRPANNAWVEDNGEARRAATKWTLRFMLWVQNLLELHTVLG
jgi:hypothetical protein